MTTREFIDKWNRSNNQERGDIAIDLGLGSKMIGVAAVQVKDENIASLHFTSIPSLRVGIWYAKTKTGKKQTLGAFRLYSNPLQTFNSWQKVCSNSKLIESVKPFFLEGYSGLVLPEHTDN